MNSGHNRTRPAAPKKPARPWRDEAMNKALQSPHPVQDLDAFVAAIRQARAEYALQIVWPDRLRTLRFLEQQGLLRSLLLSPSSSIHDDVEMPFAAWYGVDWKGEAVEVALLPGRSNKTICMGRSQQAVGDFARQMLDFSLRPAGRCLRYSEGWESAPDMDSEIGKVQWDDIVLPPPVLKQLRRSIEGFFEHRQAVRDFGFAWRRGVLLVGPPGTGKTMVCKAAAAALPEMPFLYVRDLREDEEKEAIEAIFERARKLAPCLLAFEDIDGFITPANRTVFLNEMDGFASNEGLLVIASSNHPGKIDEALLKRPSRFDRVFHLGLPAHDERRAFCERVLQRSALASRLSPELDIAALSANVASKSEGFTPAYLKEALVSAALERAQEGATVLDEEFAAQVLEQVEELRAHLKKMKNPDALGEMRSVDDVIGFRR